MYSMPGSGVTIRGFSQIYRERADALDMLGRCPDLNRHPPNWSFP
jgi:hypothetical protein